MAATNPLSSPLPADLPVNWATGQTVSPSGTDVGLTQQYGYNYLMQQVNAAQNAANTIGNAFTGLASTSDLEGVQDELTNHINDTDIHVTAEEKETWNNGINTTPVPVSVPSSGWSSSAPYTQTVSLANITESDVPEVWLAASPTDDQVIAFSMISGVSAGTASLTFTAQFSAPTVDLSLSVRW